MFVSCCFSILDPENKLMDWELTCIFFPLSDVLMGFVYIGEPLFLHSLSQITSQGVLVRRTFKAANSTILFLQIHGSKANFLAGG